MYLNRPLLNLLYILVFAFSLPSKAQVLPLNRSDSGRVAQYQALYESYNQANNLKEASRMMNEIGFIYWNYNQYKRAISFYEKSLKLNYAIDNRNGVAMLHNNLGMLYADVQDYEKALYHFSLTLAARRINKEPISIISSLKNRAVVYNNVRKYNEAIKDLQEALSLAREVNNSNEMSSAYAMLSETFEKMGNVDESIKYFKLYKSFHDAEQKNKVEKLDYELQKESLNKQIAELNAKTKEIELQQNEKKLEESKELLRIKNNAYKELYKNFTKAELIVELQKKQIKVEEAEAQAKQAEADILKKERWYVWVIAIIITLAVLIIATIIYLNSRKIKQQNQQLHQQNIAIAKQKEQLAISNDVKNKIFSIIAHDLRGPIGSLKSFFMILEEFDDIPEDVQEILEQLNIENSQISNILDNLLNWAKTQMAELTPKLQAVNVNQVVEENVNLLQRIAEGKIITLKNEVPKSLVAHSDVEMTKIVFRNLIQNALKFTKAEGTVTITGKRLSDDLLEFKVIDSGVGMSAEKVQTLFNLKSNKSTYGTNNEKGTGLGLVLCNDFIRICGGSLVVTSEENVGTTITVTLNTNHDS
ncbi:ATP-binding protein [Arcicella rigui]|uniref:histidine kinase n=1 Tax=Arcicella rigui TaxID=797020 RepID=A0ABU5Q923_9BACT|nr:ATP-binding protein [Arcicella rigui]MEA5139334.1 tetratricopeptide repeat protein [Arcicella rigui]